MAGYRDRRSSGWLSLLRPGPVARLRAGMRLVREWNGTVHIVTIGEDQGIRWNDKEWRSLSELAKAITGMRWPGRELFDLKKRSLRAEPYIS